MKRVGVVSATVLSFILLGATAFAYQKDDHQGEKEANRPQQQERAPQERASKPESRAPQQQASKPERRAPQQQASRPEPRAPQQQASNQRPTNHTQRAQVQRTSQQQQVQQTQQRSDWGAHRARSFETEHRTWQQRGGYRGYRIPDVYFSSYYGPSHWFHVYSLPFLVVGGAPRFQYDGYWFSFNDPYPEYWGSDWYQTDDVYVDYTDGGYYLYNRRFPGRPGIAISASL